MTKNNIRDKAMELRKEKKSYRQISEQLGISKSTVSLWLKNLKWSEDIIDELAKIAKTKSRAQLKVMTEKRRQQNEARRKEAAKEAARQFSGFLKNYIFLTGISIYWGEGDKQAHNGLVRMSNTDPMMLRLFIKFLKEICGVPQERIKLWLLLYPDNNEEACRKYWKRLCHVQDSQFVKTQRIVGRHKKRRLGFGVGNLYVCDKCLKVKILTWIDILGRM
ncbi:MAG: helix-turn-helix domain containing protein [Patescibacteria group bacterium]|nr:helix-turn-helix domain containing protein [Patescibacteria group bacterium]